MRLIKSVLAKLHLIHNPTLLVFHDDTGDYRRCVDCGERIYADLTVKPEEMQDTLERVH